MTTALPLKKCAVGIIPDGNRRWAEENQCDLEHAYWIAMQRLATAIDRLVELGAVSVCVFALSKDNLRRPRYDLTAVLAAEERCFRELLPPLKAKHSLKVFHAGRSDLLPESYNYSLEYICDQSADRRRSDPSLFLCAAYDPFDEVVLNGSLLSDSSSLVSNLWVPVMIDIVIRTGGDLRMSGFLPLQCKYAELFFEPYYFPDLNIERIDKLAYDFARRVRRCGT